MEGVVTNRVNGTEILCIRIQTLVDSGVAIEEGAATPAYSDLTFSSLAAPSTCSKN